MSIPDPAPDRGANPSRFVMIDREALVCLLADAQSDGDIPAHDSALLAAVQMAGDSLKRADYEVHRFLLVQDSGGKPDAALLIDRYGPDLDGAVIAAGREDHLRRLGQVAEIHQGDYDAATGWIDEEPF